MILNPTEIINLDCAVNTIQTVQVSQYDSNSRMIQVRLFNEGEEVEIPETATVRIKMLKPDGHFVLNDCEVVDNIINIVVDEQMTAVAGKCKVELLIINFVDAEVLYSTNFYLYVKESIYNNEVVESSDEYNSLIEALLAFDELDMRIQVCENIVNSYEVRVSALEDFATDNDIIALFEDGLESLEYTTHKIIRLAQLDLFKEELEENYLTPMAENIANNAEKLENAFAEEYNSASTYAVGRHCWHDNKLYECIHAILTPMSFNDYYWEEIDIPNRILPRGGEQGQVLTKTTTGSEWSDGSGGGMIDDAHTSQATTWSSAKINEEFLNRVYPVGSIYLTLNNTNPATIFGGTWEKISGKFLLGASSDYPLNQTGGEAEHKLTVPEIATHTHTGSIALGGTHYHELIPRNKEVLNFTVPSCTTWGVGGTGISAEASWGSMHAHWFGTSDARTNHVDAVGSWITSDAGGHQHSMAIFSSGQGKAHNNMPPYLAVNMWKRTR